MAWAAVGTNEFAQITIAASGIMQMQDNFIVVGPLPRRNELAEVFALMQDSHKSPSKELVLHILLCNQSQILTRNGVDSWWNWQDAPDEANQFERRRPLQNFRVLRFIGAACSQEPRKRSVKFATR
ncbi:hypothetical protein NKI01_17510 [Mesorhizobium sp. M0815]|uniref:hypothetical protein n=1 Tax=Mesorhizobium sp. M0815 TaxID=2957005 RepID=UPI0033387D09